MGTFNVECGSVFSPTDESELGVWCARRALEHPEMLSALLVPSCGCKEEQARRDAEFHALWCWE